MLLVHNDQPEIRQRREQRAAGADNDGRLALPHPHPLFASGSLVHAAVQHGHPIAEPRPESGHDVSRQGNLGHQQQGRPFPFQGFPHRMQVDLRFSAPGDAFQQETEIPARRKRGMHRLVRSPLVGVEIVERLHIRHGNWSRQLRGFGERFQRAFGLQLAHRLPGAGHDLA